MYKPNPTNQYATGTPPVDKSIYNALSALLEYPGDDIKDCAAACLESVQVGYPGAMRDLEQFSNYAASEPLQSLQELYTVTFDLKPLCTLDTGFHVFGESYKRGAFLAGMQKLTRESGLEAGTELPDHLTVVLKLLTVMPKDEEYTSLVELILAPALTRMCGEFKNSSNVYGHLLRVVDHVLRRDHGITYVQMQAELAGVPERSTDFLACGGSSGGCPVQGDDPGEPCRRPSVRELI